MDVTVLGPGKDHHTAVIVATALIECGDFVVNSKPLAHEAARALLRFHHKKSGISGDITFNETAAVRSSGAIAACAHSCPIAAFLAVCIKSVVRGAQLGPSAITSVAISIAAFGLVESIASGDGLPGDQESRVKGNPPLSTAFLEFTKFFGEFMLSHDPQTVLVTLRGITAIEPNSRFLTWLIVDPSGVNVATRCTNIHAFAHLMWRLHTSVVSHFALVPTSRAPGSHHLLQLVPELQHIVDLSGSTSRHQSRGALTSRRERRRSEKANAKNVVPAEDEKENFS